jgi:hypothetical protein
MKKFIITLLLAIFISTSLLCLDKESENNKKELKKLEQQRAQISVAQTQLGLQMMRSRNRGQASNEQENQWSKQGSQLEAQMVRTQHHIYRAQNPDYARFEDDFEKKWNSGYWKDN